ncbi:nucleoside-diphosphate sugar epimerase [Aliidongia dinghuensis]|uniref:Nucleoside-diphosphate sugar epimerase n=1 Tax=Aliidongia dinghuensis TaxID=1867774 RepID=A0A8J2Z013_9PROT|nr:complex I NDUFA9 subunit family protein [Aliidongia dinghuensis]GGF45333.1 nucleoside-diphosphate sugar epimerase [Aliidongia dinghuensis]
MTAPPFTEASSERVLLTGANGFIGRYLMGHLLAAGYHVVPAVRRPEEIDRLETAPAAIRVDMNRDVRPEDWLPRLDGIDVVINCAGVLQGRPGQSIEAIHEAAPKALFEACRRAGVSRVIQISAISAELSAGTEYALTKLAADRFLATTDLDWVILRPSLVYASGAFGGTALFRALAALPGIILVIGRGDQPFRPIHIDDLATTVLRVLRDHSINRVVIDPVGPDRVTLREVLVDLRAWLGLPPARVVPVPRALVAGVARLGDLVGGPVSTTALRQLDFGNDGNPAAFAAATGIAPRGWRQMLRACPAQWQDRWHARLYFVRPLLRGALVLTWLGSGIAGLAQPPARLGAVLTSVGLSGPVGEAMAKAFSVLDLAIALA